MRRLLFLLPMALLVLCRVAASQTLGDVARQNRAKEKSHAKLVKKVVTNDDIPESPEPSPAKSESTAKAETPSASSADPAPKSAREWRMAIMTQEDRIETLQAQIEKLTASIHFVPANAYVNGAEYNQYQVRKQQEVRNLQKQLEEQEREIAKWLKK